MYDVQTGRRTLTLFQESLAGRYRRNRATFSPSDQLLLNDGVLWDVRSSRAVHRFDQFNGSVSGQFHPNGLEVVANTEVVSCTGISGTSTGHAGQSAVAWCLFLALEAWFLIPGTWNLVPGTSYLMAGC